MQQQQSLSDLLVKDIDPAARQWVETVIGRALADDERLSLLAYHPDIGDTSAGRYAARERLLKMMDKAAVRVQQSGITCDTLDDAIEEAIDHTRMNRP